MILKENERLDLHTTLRTGGPARFFVEAKTDDELREAITFARGRGWPTFVLGGGSNVLASDDGFDGVVVKMATHGMRTESPAADVVEVVAQAGEEWDTLVAFAVARGLAGLENMSLIPGSVGAAVVGNIGAYGSEVKDALVWTQALDMRTGLIRRFASEECGFAYRRSFFKTTEGRNYIVTQAAFALKTHGAVNAAYRDVQELLATRGVIAPTLAQMREAVIEIRRRKLPDLARIGTAGSFFKNPVIPRRAYERLAARYPQLPGHDEGNGLVKVPLGWILDRVCGLKGVRRGRVGTHVEQALVIVNDGGTSQEVEAFAHEIAEAVRENTSLAIEWEVERVG